MMSEPEILVSLKMSQVAIIVNMIDRTPYQAVRENLPVIAQVIDIKDRLEVAVMEFRAKQGNGNSQ